jgi:hypothetical protein
VRLANAHARTRPRSGRKLRYRVRVTKNSISIIISTTASMWPPYCMYSSHIRLSERNSRPRSSRRDVSDLRVLRAIRASCASVLGAGGRGGAVDRTIPGAFGLVTSFCRPSPTEPAWPHASGTSAWPGRCGRIGLQLIQPHEVLLLESVCCFVFCHGDASIVGDGEYLPELRRYDCVTVRWQNSMLRSRLCRSAPLHPIPWAWILWRGDRVCTSPSRCWYRREKGWSVHVWPDEDVDGWAGAARETSVSGLL